MVHPDLNHLICSNEVCPPLAECPDHSQELLVIHIIVLLSSSESLRDVVNDSPGPICLQLREHSTCRQVACICLYLPSPFVLGQSQDWGRYKCQTQVLEGCFLLLIPFPWNFPTQLE